MLPSYALYNPEPSAFRTHLDLETEKAHLYQAGFLAQGALNGGGIADDVPRSSGASLATRAWLVPGFRDASICCCAPFAFSRLGADDLLSSGKLHLVDGSCAQGAAVVPGPLEAHGAGVFWAMERGSTAVVVGVGLAVLRDPVEA